MAFRTAAVLHNETEIDQRIAARIYVDSSATPILILPLAIGLVVQRIVRVKHVNRFYPIVVNANTIVTKIR